MVMYTENGVSWRANQKFLDMTCWTISSLDTLVHTEQVFIAHQEIGTIKSKIICTITHLLQLVQIE